ncbi:MAG: M20 family metallopeptidase [Acidobacteria bacterium]|jgi:glutamate carboxypeptidase|nr:M20 family metallopeptidase [Bryobacteraceae bacterium CoA2 C42]
MDSFLSWARANERRIVATIREMVECESPSDNPAAINRQVDQIADRWGHLAKVTRKKAKGHGDHLLLEFALPGKRRAGQLLALGHTDTVWPLGTLRTMPWREAEGRLWGPGVYDMKGGVAFFLHAMEGLRELAVPVPSKVVLLLDSDEEIGSPSSRDLIEAQARKSAGVLVLEPGTGPTGKLKTARKGVGGYQVTARGIAAHAGVDFSNGANAIVELARQIDRIAGFTDLKIGLTVNPGVIGGGTRSNVVPAEASVDVDIRIARLKDAGPLEKKFRALKPVDGRCTLTITGSLNRPPMERTKAIAAWFAQARQLAAQIGIALEESSTGGGSDGNFTAALGVPTLDGLGAVGEGAHAVNESLFIDRIADRTALLAGLVAGAGTREV